MRSKFASELCVLTDVLDYSVQYEVLRTKYVHTYIVYRPMSQGIWQLADTAGHIRRTCLHAVLKLGRFPTLFFFTIISRLLRADIMTYEYT